MVLSLIVSVILAVFAVVFVGATLVPLLRRDEWWIRVFDFPRIQIAAGGAVVALLLFVLPDALGGWGRAAGILLVACVLYQCYRMFPYTALARRQVHATPLVDADASFSLLFANVLMDNRAADRFFDLVRTYDPDLILTVETDHWWEEQLRALEADYPHTVKAPLDNTYGMLLHARLALVDPKIVYLVEDDIPSFHMQVRLPNGVLFRLYCVHPRPPYPAETDDTTERDAELLVVGRLVKEHGGPAVVAGDLNDVAWSHTTHLFQRISGLLDPRVGRGMYNTFDARNPLLRWPLDHCFHSEHFKLVRLERLPAWGSDHFPMLIHLQHDPSAPVEHDKPDADQEDREEAVEKIEKADVDPRAPAPTD